MCYFGSRDGGVHKIIGHRFNCETRSQVTQMNNFLKWKTDVEVTQSKYLSQMWETFLSF